MQHYWGRAEPADYPVLPISHVGKSNKKAKKAAGRADESGVIRSGDLEESALPTVGRKKAHKQGYKGKLGNHDPSAMDADTGNVAVGTDTPESEADRSKRRKRKRSGKDVSSVSGVNEDGQKKTELSKAREWPAEGAPTYLASEALKTSENLKKRKQKKRKSQDESILAGLATPAQPSVAQPSLQTGRTQEKDDRKKDMKRKHSESRGNSLSSNREEPEASQGPSLIQKAEGSKLSQRLLGSKFRWLNERLYTTTGERAFLLMSEQPELFAQYHKGFDQQTQGWPVQPVELAIKWLRKQPKAWKVADFGCGNAQLAASVPQHVVSLDLVAAVPGVIACNMSHTPLDSESMDVVVFCLALMGVDYPSFLREAKRVLKTGGRLWIAEVRSRFAKDRQEDLGPFVTACKKLGLRLLSQTSSKMFVVLDFVLDQKSEGHDIDWPELKACLYKQR